MAAERDAVQGHSRRNRARKDRRFYVCGQQAFLLKEQSEPVTGDFVDAQRDRDTDKENTGFSEGLWDGWSSRGPESHLHAERFRYA